MSRHQDVVVTSLHTFCSLSLVVTMSRHRFSCRDITVRLCRLYWLLFMSRHQVSCRDISSWYCAFEQASPVVVTSALSLCQFQHVVLDVATSVFLSRHHLMLLLVALVVYDVATSDFLSRHHFFNFCSFLSCLRCDPCRDLLHLFLQLS